MVGRVGSLFGGWRLWVSKLVSWVTISMPPSMGGGWGAVSCNHFGSSGCRAPIRVFPTQNFIKFIPPFRNTQVLRGETGESPP